MAETVTFTQYPYVVWQIKGFYSISRINTDYFCHESGRFYLYIKQVPCLNVEDDYFAIYLEEWGTFTDTVPNFSVVVCIADKYKQNRFVQTTLITSPNLENPVCVWYVRRRDLISEYDELLTDDVLTFICALGPQSEDLVIGQLMHEKHDKSVQVSPLGERRCLQALSDDLLSCFERQAQPDVVLQCENRCFPVHKAILSARSKVFSAMFQHDMSESQSGVISVIDIAPDIVKQLLMYLYSGTLDILILQSAIDLYRAGDKYAVEGLKERCIDFILKKLTRENAYDFLLLADAHCDFKFIDSIVDFIFENETMLKEQAWIKFWRDQSELAFRVYEAYVAKLIHRN